MEFREINKIVRNLNLYKNKCSKTHELNDSEFEVIRYVSKRESRPQGEIAEYLNVDKALVSRMIKKLERLGYIEILEDSNDKRKKLIKCTSKGYSVKDNMYLLEVEYFNAITNVLSDTDKEIFLNLVNKVYLESKRLRKKHFEDINNENL